MCCREYQKNTTVAPSRDEILTVFDRHYGPCLTPSLKIREARTIDDIQALFQTREAPVRCEHCVVGING